MNHFQIKKLTAAVVAVLGAGIAGSAFAAVTLGTPVKFASELTTPVALTNLASVLDAKTGGLAAVNALSVPITYRIDLTGGVVFSADPTFTCSATIGTAGNTNPADTATIVFSKAAGGSLQNYVLFTLPTSASLSQGSAAMGVTLTAGDTMYLSGGAVNTANCTLAAATYSASDQATKSVSAVVTYVIGGVTYTDNTTRGGTFITFSKGLSASFAASTTATQIDGVTNSMKFTDADKSTTTANLGSFTFLTAGSVLRAAGDAVTAADVLSSGSITISGATLAAATTGNVWLTTAGVSACTTADYPSTTAGSSITFSGITAATMSALATSALAIQVCIKVPGTTVIQESALGGSFSAAATATATPNTAASNVALDDVTTNGQTRNAYLVHSALSTAKRTNIRILNKSGLTGTVLGTLYNEAGTDIGGGQKTLATFTADQQMATLQSADIEAAFGTALAATAKGHIKFYFAKGNFEVLNFTQDIASGALTLNNTSTTTTK